MSDRITWFGKHQGKDISEVPSGYLRWAVENIDPNPLPRDRVGKSVEEVEAMVERMKGWIELARNELEEREHHDQR